MSKVLIDRAVLEATLEHAEFVSGAACEADDAIRSALSAPSGTPVMPAKAYYYEAPNGHGGLNKSVGLEQRKTFSDAPLVLESDALAQIACLEGEIAKRDAELCERTEEVEYALADLNNALAELAAIKAQEPVTLSDDVREYLQEGINSVTQCEDSDIDYDFANELAKLLDPLYAAPVSEAKAHGVVMPADIKAPAGGEWGAGFKCGYESYKREFIHLNDAPAAPGAKP